MLAFILVTTWRWSFMGTYIWNFWFWDFWFKDWTIIFSLMDKLLLRFWLKKFICRSMLRSWLCICTYCSTWWSFCWRNFYCTLRSDLYRLFINIYAFVYLWSCVYWFSMWTSAWKDNTWSIWFDIICFLIFLLFFFIFMFFLKFWNILILSFNYLLTRKCFFVSFLHISLFLRIDFIFYSVLSLLFI